METETQDMGIGCEDKNDDGINAVEAVMDVDIIDVDFSETQTDEIQSDTVESNDTPKEGVPPKLNLRLLAGLIVALLVIIALAIGTGVAVSGLTWYDDQVNQLTSDNRQMTQTISDLEQQRQAAEDRADELSSELDELKQQQEVNLTELGKLKEQLASMQQQAPMPVYPADAKLIALTFDDGPGDYTNTLLDELKKRNIKATFFVLGLQVQKHMDIVKRMASEGHVIGNHSYSHKNLKSLTAEQVQADLDKCTSLIVEATGTVPSVLRVPGGNYNENVIAYASKQNMQIIQWSVDTKDWKSKNKDAILGVAFQSGKYGIHDGAIVLMHDVYSTSVDAAVEMMDRLIQEGYTMVTVPELIRVRDNGGKAGNVYSTALKK